MKLRIAAIAALVLLAGLFTLISKSHSPKIKWDDAFRGGIHILLEVESRGDSSLDDKNTESVKRGAEYRLKYLGVKENERIVKNLGNRMVVVQLPYIKNNQRMVDVLCRWPFIEFKFVRQVNEDSGVSFENGMPEGCELRMLEENGKKKEILVEKEAVLASDSIDSVVITEDSDKKPILGLRFNAEGSKRLAKLTKENIGRRLAIIFEEKVLMAPKIKEAIPNGELVITGKFSRDELIDLELMFKAGGSVRVKVVEVGKLTENNWMGGKLKKIILSSSPVSAGTAEEYFNLGFNNVKQGNLSQAILEFTKAIEMNPGYADAYNNRGVAYAKQGNFNQAAADYNKAIEINPNDANAYLNRGRVYDIQDNILQAVSFYTKAIEINPNYAEAYYSRGRAYYMEKEYDKAWMDVHRVEELGETVTPELLNALKKASGRDK